MDEKDDESPPTTAERSSETADDAPAVQFGLNSLFVVVVMVALICGWVVDRNKLQRQLDANLVVLRHCRNTLAQQLMAAGKGSPVSKFPDLLFLGEQVHKLDDEFANRLKSDQSPAGQSCTAYYVDRRVDPNKNYQEGECYSILVYIVDDTIVRIDELSDES